MALGRKLVKDLKPNDNCEEPDYGKSNTVH